MVVRWLPCNRIWGRFWCRCCRCWVLFGSCLCQLSPLQVSICWGWLLVTLLILKPLLLIVVGIILLLLPIGEVTMPPLLMPLLLEAVQIICWLPCSSCRWRCWVLLGGCLCQLSPLQVSICWGWLL